MSDSIYVDTYRLGSTRVKPSEDMGNLSRDACAALEAGMSYGQYKAMHPHTGTSEAEEDTQAAKQPEAKWKQVKCKQCGKEFWRPSGRNNKVYCSEKCRWEANQQIKNRKYIPKEPRTYVCAVCGADFKCKRFAKYCSPECYREGQRQNDRRRRKEANDAEE